MARRLKIGKPDVQAGRARAHAGDQAGQLARATTRSRAATTAGRHLDRRALDRDRPEGARTRSTRAMPNLSPA